MKKKLAFLLALTALLSGCKGEPTPTSTAAPTASASPSLAPESTLAPPTLEDAEPWWIGVELSKLPTEEIPVYEVDGVTWRVTCDAPELGVTLYDVEKAGVGYQFVLRKGELLDEVFRSPGVGSDAFYSLFGGDYDGDGQTEYAISLYRQFYLCKENGQGGWNSLFYGPEDYSALLDEVLDIHSDPRSVTIYCDGASASYGLGDGIQGTVAFQDDYPSLPLWFDFSQDRIQAVIPLLASVPETHTADIFGALRYTLAYDGRNFTAQEFHLEGSAGV